MWALLLIFSVPFVLAFFDLGLFFVNPDIAKVMLVIFIPFSFAWLFITSIISLVVLLLKPSAEKLEQRMQDAAANDPVYNNLPRLGQLRVDINRAKREKYYFPLIATGIALVLGFVFPPLWFLPFIAWSRFVYRSYKEGQQAIATAEAERDQILGEKSSLGNAKYTP